MGANNTIQDPRRNLEYKEKYCSSAKHRLAYHGVSNVKGGLYESDNKALFSLVVIMNFWRISICYYVYFTKVKTKCYQRIEIKASKNIPSELYYSRDRLVTVIINFTMLVGS